MKKYAVATADSNVEIIPATMPPYNAETITARKNSGEDEGCMYGHNSHVINPATLHPANGRTSTRTH